ncbi:hypothetical protein Bca52824_074939 [Brassica carinata]|uniref:Uncharacterized protein n=1 Tax=Brassica carinata TaxID=52824 RepID=A0A8X7TUY5_BRACI|nr:hypothetical protein Bca52824_074939 [Brassica carinata]
MPHVPAKRVIVLGRPAPSATPAAVPKSRKRPSANPDAAKRKRCTEAGPLPTKTECGSEIERLAKELDESREMSSLLEGNLKVIQDAHFVEEARFDSRIGELKRDLGKTVICLLKAKEAKASKSSELRRLKRKVKSGEGSSVCVIREAKEPMRAEFQTRLARIADSLDSLAAIHVPHNAGTLVDASVPCVPDALVHPAGSSTTPIFVEGKERAAESMPPPPARKEIGRKRKFTKGGDGESSQQGGLNPASELRGKFMSLIDEMISECGSEASCLAGELTEMQGRWSETEAMLKAVKDSHSAKVSKLEVEIGELERNPGKTASSLLKEKKARKAKSSEVC